MVYRSRCGGSYHICGTRTNGRRTGYYFSAIILFCKCGGNVCHALLVFALINRESASVGVKCLAESANYSVTEYRKNSVNEFCLLAVKRYVLIVKEFYESLRGSHICHSFISLFIV